MVNLGIFSSLRARRVPATDAVNEAGGRAYAMSDRHALAQYAATGCLNNTFYASAAQQLDHVRSLCARVDPTFLAKTAVYTREKGFMKDMPALLLAELATRDGELLERIFSRVCDNGKMLRNFVQIVRSGATGRRSLGSRPKRLVQRWLDRRSDAQVFAASVGNSPSLADILRMVHPRPTDAGRRALYGYMLGRPYDVGALPECARAYENFKAGYTDQVPDVPFQMLTSLPLSDRAWQTIAGSGGWQMLRMNLNTFVRHGVFHEPKLVKRIAQRLADPAEVRRARAFPYQLMVAHAQIDPQVPRPVREALHAAMEAAIANVPEIDGQIYVLPDVSGSMHSPVTGARKGSTTKVRCVDVAALVAAAFLRRNHSAEVLPFHTKVLPTSLTAHDSVLTNAEKLARLPGGGTDCAAPLRELNRRKARGDLVVFISDNESWVDGRPDGRGTHVMKEWEIYKQRNRKARLVCIDIQPNTTLQALDRDDILNIGGFSDAVFDLIAAFARGGLRPEHWVGVIDAIDL